VQSSVTTPAAASVPAFVDSTSGVTPAPSVPTLSEPTLVVASSRGAGADTSPALPERGAITAKTTVVKRSDAGAVPQSRRKLDCDPPYTLDSAGQHFKEECFH
jgi:hypothetical protein